MSKLYRARSLLYRRQILQQNIRWKALDEIYKLFRMFQHFLQKFVFFEYFSLNFAQILMKFYRNFADILENVENQLVVAQSVVRLFAPSFVKRYHNVTKFRTTLRPLL